jgi:recombination protein RecA
MAFPKKDKSKPKKKAATAETELKGAGNALKAAHAYLKKKKGKEFTDIVVNTDEGSLSESLPHIASGSDVVDYLIGGSLNSFGVAPCPGYPRGRVTQIWGHEAAGKTTLALEACAAVCAEPGGTALYIDWENDIVPDYAAALGVPITDSNKFMLLQPETLEDGIKYAAAYAAAGVDLIVFDSIGAGVVRRLAERDALDVAEQGKVGELQSVWSQELPNLKRVIAKPQGGNAWKFYSSVRLELRRVQNQKAREFNELTHSTDERVVGGIVKVTAIKCKMSRSQGREEIFYIRWGEGVDNVRTIIEIASDHGLVKKSGSWVTWEAAPEKSLKVQGVEKLRSRLIEDAGLYEALRAQVMPLLGQGGASQYVDEIDEVEEDVPDLEKILGESGFTDKDIDAPDEGDAAPAE